MYDVFSVRKEFWPNMGIIIFFMRKYLIKYKTDRKSAATKYVQKTSQIAND